MNLKNKLVTLITTIYSLIAIFLKTELLNKKKNIMFYFPVKIYQENLIKLINKLKKKNLTIFLIYNLNSREEIKNYPNSFFLDFSYLKFIPFNKLFLNSINLFVTSYVAYVFPPKSKNIYISHDIYDAPMVNKNIEKIIFNKLKILDYIFASSLISKNYFLNKFKEYKIQQQTKIINTGYLKLDHIHNKTRKITNSKSILIAPGFSLCYKQLNMSEKLEKIFFKILNTTEKNIIYRPHPLDITHKGNQVLTTKIKEKYLNNKRFFFDNSISYLESYNNSQLLITDLSSIAYTYAFSTEKPVIFFSKNEKLLRSINLYKLNYFKDRNKIGLISNNENSLIDALKKINSLYYFYKKNIKSLRSKRIEHFQKATAKTSDFITKIVEEL
jgi:hypothetical protein